MGQKSLIFSVNKCIPIPFKSDVYDQVTYQTTQPCSKFEVADQTEDRRYTTEQISRWMQRFNKAKIASRKESCLRKVALLNNAFLFAKNELKCRQEQRLQRWKVLKPLLHLESMVESGLDEMAVRDHKMASQHHEMADDSMDLDVSERPSTPLPGFGLDPAVKRNRSCDLCSSTDLCSCEKDSPLHQTKKFRPASEEDDLKSLDQFLSSLHCNSRQVG